ncbi:hypothetical protein [Microbacterium sp.]|uniref:hypothetical protein n=1 Tax=Microbacterium sp. TaxID=51671 RepID=UPI002811053D|nr:hypothetical protein [Microbacterium sp.]
MTAVTLHPPTTAIPSLRITTSERLALRAADAVAAYVHRRAMRRDARLLADLERERLLAASRLAAMRAMALDVPRR